MSTEGTETSAFYEFRVEVQTTHELTQKQQDMLEAHIEHAIEGFHDILRGDGKGVEYKRVYEELAFPCRDAR